MGVPIKVSPGELIDRLTILEIKEARMTDPAKRRIAARERALLSSAHDAHLSPPPVVARLRAELKAVNEALWQVEDDIRLCEAQSDFGADFVALARRIYKTNDRRSALKQALDHAFGAEFHDVKSHELPDAGDF